MQQRICSAHQPAFLPWLGTIHKVATSDVFVVMDMAKFLRRAFMHRNRIEVNGAPHYVGLTLPSGADSAYCDEVTISPHHPTCLQDIARTLERTYKHYPHFDDLDAFIEHALIHCGSADLNRIYLIQLTFLCAKLGIRTSIRRESEMFTREELRQFNASERLLEHALRTHATVYVTGINSTAYLDAAVFERERIAHRVQEFSYVPFRRLQKCDVPLSIVHHIASLGYERLGEALRGLQTIQGLPTHSVVEEPRVPDVNPDD
jgi:hypothetical protein